MKLLALDTSTEYCSVAVWQDGTITQCCELVGQKHSERLIAMIAEVLRAADCTLQEMQGIAFGKGPGSFTGVRIACGATQGLALGANLPVLGVCTLEALAQASGHHKVIAALDARMAELYFAAYQKQGEVWRAVVEPRLCKPEDAPDLSDNDWVGVGSGFAAHGAALQTRYAEQLIQVDGSVVPQAVAIAQLGAAGFARGEGVDAARALPLYLRDKVALKTSEREAR